MGSSRCTCRSFASAEPTGIDRTAAEVEEGNCNVRTCVMMLWRAVMHRINMLLSFSDENKPWTSGRKVNDNTRPSGFKFQECSTDITDDTSVSRSAISSCHSLLKKSSAAVADILEVLFSVSVDKSNEQDTSFIANRKIRRSTETYCLLYAIWYMLYHHYYCFSSLFKNQYAIGNRQYAIGVLSIPRLPILHFKTFFSIFDDMINYQLSRTTIEQQTSVFAQTLLINCC